MAGLFVKKLPRAKRDTYCTAHIRPLSARIVDWWHRRIQPVIDGNPARPDAGWSWPFITAFNWWTRPPQLWPQGFAICLDIAKGVGEIPQSGYPIALEQLVVRCPFIEDMTQHAVLLHYLTTIPRDLLPDSSEVRLVGTASVDVALVRAFQLDYAGRTMLSITTKNADQLARWYTEDCGMMRATTAHSVLGNWFVHHPETAERAYLRLEHLRT